ncbi:hypothetical protein ACE1TI_06910 [Alteribacillus sp. JSM 102045]|uniref:hypothetical protein n=1 Tax=Alteribacillus sp. JSM 102045 TaxID=1562101 RepID=UPI0035C0C6F6
MSKWTKGQLGLILVFFALSSSVEVLRSGAAVSGSKTVSVISPINFFSMMAGAFLVFHFLFYLETKKEMNVFDRPLWNRIGTASLFAFLVFITGSVYLFENTNIFITIWFSKYAFIFTGLLLLYLNIFAFIRAFFTGRQELTSTINTTTGTGVLLSLLTFLL